MAKELILVVDDYEPFRTACIKALKLKGYMASGASSGEIAVSLLDKYRYDLLIIDYKMGDVSGLDVIRKVKETNPETEIIMVTAFPTQELAKEVLRELKGSSFLCKPVEFQKIVTTVETCLERRATKKEFDQTSRKLKYPKNS
ncbi:MAG: response regulator [Endomicrobiales bacterium]|nr:response regulator [Endomicrobiales bacterium]